MALRRLRAGHKTLAAPHRLRAVPRTDKLRRQRTALRVAKIARVERAERGIVPLLQLVLAGEEGGGEAFVADARGSGLGLRLSDTLLERQQCEPALLLAVSICWEQHLPYSIHAFATRALLQHGLIGTAGEEPRSKGVLRIQVDERAERIDGGGRCGRWCGGSGGGGGGRGERVAFVAGHVLRDQYTSDS